MNHTKKCELLVYMDENPNDLTLDQLACYQWLVEQLLQELRERQLARRTQAAQDNPVRLSPSARLASTKKWELDNLP